MADHRQDSNMKSRLEAQTKEELVTEVARLQDQLIRCEREMKDFVYVLSHDLREPINTMTAFGKLLVRTCSDELTEDGKMYVKYIAESGEHGSQMITDLLDHSRIGRDEMLENVSLEELTDEVVSNLGSQLEKANANIVREELPEVQGYRNALRLMLTHLIGNATKFVVNDRKPLITISSSSTDKGVSITISDNGIGMKKSDLEKIFTVFRRLHPRSVYGGTGIGLTHVKKVAELHAAEIHVESEIEKGSAFTILFPKMAVHTASKAFN